MNRIGLPELLGKCIPKHQCTNCSPHPTKKTKNKYSMCFSILQVLNFSFFFSFLEKILVQACSNVMQSLLNEIYISSSKEF